mgnify:CR=1 FL=1
MLSLAENEKLDFFNRGKRSITVDLNVEGATELLHRLLEDADVFLVSLLPSARRKLKIDIEDITSRHPRLIYAVGSGQGAFGPEADKGGYDSLSFWARGGVASAVTPDGSPHVLQQPTGAFGDSISGAILAGGIAAALATAAIAAGDISRVPGYAVAEFTIAGGALLASLASFAGVLRKKPADETVPD